MDAEQKSELACYVERRGTIYDDIGTFFIRTDEVEEWLSASHKSDDKWRDIKWGKKNNPHI